MGKVSHGVSSPSIRLIFPNKWNFVTLALYVTPLLWDLLNNNFRHTSWCCRGVKIQYIPRNMHTVFALLCFVVVIHWLIFPYPSSLLHWHCGNLTIAPVPAKQPWWIWINTSCVFIMNDCITTTKQSTTKPCAYFLGYTVLCALLDLCTEDSPFICRFPSKRTSNTAFWRFLCC